ncbi:MAG: hypothetical protein ACRC0X_02555 [Brevinema sp.]
MLVFRVQNHKYLSTKRRVNYGSFRPREIALIEPTVLQYYARMCPSLLLSINSRTFERLILYMRTKRERGGVKSRDKGRKKQRERERKVSKRECGWERQEKGRERKRKSGGKNKRERETDRQTDREKGKR